MKRILIFLYLFVIGFADAAVRDNSTQTKAPVSQTASRSGQNQNTDRTTSSANSNTVSRSATSRDISNRDSGNNSPQRANLGVVRSGIPTTIPQNARNTVNRNTVKSSASVTARAADTLPTAMSETRTGAEYEKCKSSYFDCMDQFCKLKNDDYRRCSCSDRVYKFQEVKTVIQDANEKLTAFTESLDTVGMTAAQANAMRKSSEGENALTSDSSASKALLQAIMNSIKGEDANVGGKFSSLNSINMSFDTNNSFGTLDAGQAIAAYNGQNLYSAIYGQCRNAVKNDCNNASLQRAVTAYLMAIEQDCNTVQTTINENQKKMTAAVREGNAMLDLARVENRQKHNSDDMTDCMRNVEAAILSEEVCGTGYHKCLDNGEFIDITTGAPIAGVVRFYELEGLLKFDNSVNMSDQKLAKISNNRLFVQNFEKRVKKFAQPALDKCIEKSDAVWSDYLDKAMLDIYYAQKSKVTEIKQGCFDFVSACYMNGNNALTAAMVDLMGESGVVLQPDKIALNSAVCREYVASCDNMFDGNIVKQYVQDRENTDTLTACRAVAKQCFDKFGGKSYENFFYPYSGIFDAGHAVDWFSLCDGKDCLSYKSECAKQLSQISSCSDPEMMRNAFGGMDYLEKEDERIYGLIEGTEFKFHALRPSGVATEIYNQIIDILSTQCINVQGRFVELQFLKQNMYNPDNICISSFDQGNSYNLLMSPYGIKSGEDMCPRDYTKTVDTKSWGACLCWENGARRSRWGTSVKCLNEVPVTIEANSSNCSVTMATAESSPTGEKNWCTQKISSKNQVCPLGASIESGKCKWDGSDVAAPKIPDGVM